MANNALATEIFQQKYREKFEGLYVKEVSEGTIEEQYNALVDTLKSIITRDFLATNRKYKKENCKQVYYFCIEFLPGKFLEKNLISLGMRDEVKKALADMDIDLEKLFAVESEPGLGSGGLGRLAACFMDSMASLAVPGHGNGIRYRFGLFEQRLVEGHQVELPDNWLSKGNPWEYERRDKAVVVRLGGQVDMQELEDGKLEVTHHHYKPVLAVPYDIPVVGYHNGCVNTLRLWSAEAVPEYLEPRELTKQEYRRILEYKYTVEQISSVLYPDDSSEQGQSLRLQQQYFMVAAGVQTIFISQLKRHEVEDLPDFVAIHINDTHPTLVIPELMRQFLDYYRLDWETSWDLVTRMVSYTNHTVLPEALEKWPLSVLGNLLPRIAQIIVEIDRRFCEELRLVFNNDESKVRGMAIIDNGMVHMAHLAVVASYSVNGVARVHSDILKNELMLRFNKYYPNKFNNKTNGIAFGRWLVKANTSLADLIIDRVGEKALRDANRMKSLTRLADDDEFLEELGRIKYQNKVRLAKYIGEKLGITVNPKSIFDVQAKRIHAYKRQLLNILHVMYLYNALIEDPTLDIEPRTFIFAGKSAKSYHFAKSVIQLINCVANKVNNSKEIGEKLKVVFIPNYSVGLAEFITTAADVSEQISTAGKEASGTGNMKMMLNGAITIGTMDGANVEIAEAVGEDNFVAFGLSIAQVSKLNYSQQYSATKKIEDDDRLQQLINQLRSGFWGLNYDAVWNIVDHYTYNMNDEFLVCMDFDSYVKAQETINDLYKDKKRWLKMSLYNTANSGFFSSERTIREYAKDIWNIEVKEV